VAKAFNANFAALYDRLGGARTPPRMVYAADEEARSPQAATGRFWYRFAPAEQF
jgi:hypothetical protein